MARIVQAGAPCHVTHRGNQRGAVFFGDLDRQLYLADLAVWAHDAGLAVWGYCLMDNHVHLVAVPVRPFGGSRPHPLTGRPIGWGEWLALGDKEETEAFDRLRQATRTGRPCGGEAFVEALETRLGRTVGARKRGRKPKEEVKDDNQLELF